MCYMCCMCCLCLHVPVRGPSNQEQIQQKKEEEKKKKEDQCNGAQFFPSP